MSDIPELARFVGIPVPGEFKGWRGAPAINPLIRVLVEIGTQIDLNTGKRFIEEHPDVMTQRGKPYNIFSKKQIDFPYPLAGIMSRLLIPQTTMAQNMWAGNEYPTIWTMPGGTEEAKAGKRIGPKGWRVPGMPGVQVPGGRKMTRKVENIGDWLKELSPIKAVESREK